MDSIALSPQMRAQIAEARAETLRYVWRQFLALFARRA
jgi:hypothetical protein